MKNSNLFQSFLIALGLLCTILFGIFFYRELFPEYRIYQDDYIALEEFRSSYTNELPPRFQKGVKQIVLERLDKGNPVIDRCTTCHVALQIEAFSPTKVAKDINGNIAYDAQGFPIQEVNDDYIWKRLDQAIQLTDDPNLKNKYLALKTTQVGENIYNVEKVLQAHPLMGREVRPFEYHPIEEYGCTSCHGGNGRGIVTDRAHGPVFDGQYVKEDMGFVPKFLESDPKNDPKFSHVFNSKPGHRLLFQTTPIYVGALMQAKCVQCHQSLNETINDSASSATAVLNKKEKELKSIEQALSLDEQAAATLLYINQLLKTSTYQKLQKFLKNQAEDYTLPLPERQAFEHQYKSMQELGEENFANKVRLQLLSLFGSEEMLQIFAEAFDEKNPLASVKEKLFEVSLQKPHSGALFAKILAVDYTKSLIEHIEEISSSFEKATLDKATINSLTTDVDLLTEEYQKGQSLFISQACYACHRIAGFARGGIGPDLTKIGDSYPWYIKESIVWPQADLKTSTMPNMKLDHEELEALMTYLLSQTGQRKILAEPTYKATIQAWEAGKKKPWEAFVPYEKIQDIRYGMTIFAVEGCASCHRLEGYASNVGFAIEKEDPPLDKLEKERTWFKTLFPESATGSQIVKAIDQHQEEIHQKIVPNVRKGSILEEIETTHPGLIASFYSPFKYAMRAKNHENTLTQKNWQDSVQRVLMQYVQTYGLGRVICPKLNWSGVYRNEQWLMEHFKNPSGLVPKSIMPTFPFDNTKFYALTQMLAVLGKENVARDHLIWATQGFNPEIAFKTYCATCHGDHLLGNGPVSSWIYPIPKNLNDPTFLHNLTKEKAIASITHGVKGTPMPPWGEVGVNAPSKLPVLGQKEIKTLVDWLFSTIPQLTILAKDSQIPKWNYSASDVLQELKEEKNSFSPSDMTVDTIFSTVIDQNGEKIYSIKKELYTKENLLAGKRFFMENCASCHGTEGDGAGLKAEAMSDAKPRMFINLDWNHSRDDLRLLRSIKYGVAGTAMTPWGDLTNGMQRMQLVVFIRSLVKNASERKQLTDALYQSFDATIFQLEKAIAKDKETKLLRVLELEKKGRDLFFIAGSSLLNLNPSETLWQEFIDLIHLNKVAFQEKNGELIFSNQAEWNENYSKLKNKFLNSIDLKISEFKLQNKEQIALWRKEKNQLIATFSAFERIRLQKEKL